MTLTLEQVREAIRVGLVDASPHALERLKESGNGIDEQGIYRLVRDDSRIFHQQAQSSDTGPRILLRIQTEGGVKYGVVFGRREGDTSGRIGLVTAYRQLSVSETMDGVQTRKAEALGAAPISSPQTRAAVAARPLSEEQAIDDLRKFAVRYAGFALAGKRRELTKVIRTIIDFVEEGANGESSTAA